MPSLFDHLVGAYQERFRDPKAKRLRSFEINHQLELGWSLDGQIGGVYALKDAADITRSLPEERQKIRTIGHQPADLWKRIEQIRFAKRGVSARISRAR